jgi:hypothetical protein
MRYSVEDGLNPRPLGPLASKLTTTPLRQLDRRNEVKYHHHHSEHDQGLGLKTCSFEAQGVPGPSILLSVFSYPAIPKVGTGRPASVGGFYPFVPGGLPISFDTVLCPSLCCPFSNCYGSQGFSGGPIL